MKLSSAAVRAPEHIAYLLDMGMRRLVAELPQLMDFDDFPALRGSHLRLLMIVPEGGARPTELSEAAGVTKQALGQFVSHLEEHGYVEVTDDPSDGRAVVVRHTARGDAAARAGLAAVLELEQRWSAQVGAARFEMFRSVLGELVNLERWLPGLSQHPRSTPSAE